MRIVFLFCIFIFTASVNVLSQNFRVYGDAGIQSFLAGKTSALGNFSLSSEIYDPRYSIYFRVHSSASFDTVRANHISYVANTNSMGYGIDLQIRPYRWEIGNGLYLSPLGAFSWGGGSLFGSYSNDTGTKEVVSAVPWFGELGVSLQIAPQTVPAAVTPLVKAPPIRLNLNLLMVYHEIGGTLGLPQYSNIRSIVTDQSTTDIRLRSIDFVAEISISDKVIINTRLTKFIEEKYHTTIGNLGIAYVANFLE